MNPGLLLSLLARLSVQAAVVVVVILLVQAAFRKCLAPRWRCALWLLLVARLLLPVSPPSPVSIFSLSAFRFWAPNPVVAPEPRSATAASVPLAVAADEAAFRVAPSASSVDVPPVRQARIPAASSLKRRSAFFWGWVWLAGFAVFLLQIAFRSARWKSRFAGSPRVFDPAVVALVEECAESLGIQTRLAVFESSAVTSPILYGVFKPRVVLPKGFVGRFTHEDLRFVILHEMVHLKNGDLIINWLSTGLQAVHWFNPLVWFGFERWRADRELACDAVVLKTVGAARKRDYGETIIQLLEGCARPAAVPGHVGVSAAPGELRSRLAMIVEFEPTSRWSGLALLLVAGVGTACLTNAPAQRRALFAPALPAATPAVKNPMESKVATVPIAIATSQPLAKPAEAVAVPDRAIKSEVHSNRITSVSVASATGEPVAMTTVNRVHEQPSRSKTIATQTAAMSRTLIDGGPPTRVAVEDAPAAEAPGAIFAGQSDVRVDVVVDMTDAGRKIVRPTPDKPAYYFPLTAGYKELGAFVPDQQAPPTLEVQHLIAKALYNQGYRVMSSRQAPSLVLVFWWGHIAPEISSTELSAPVSHTDAFNRTSFFGADSSALMAELPTNQSANEKLMVSLVAGNTRDYQYPTDNPNPKLDQILTMERSPRHFVMMSAFDFQDWAKHKTTLLWQAHISTELAGHSFGDVLPTLVAAAAPMFGRETTSPQLIAAPPTPLGGRVIIGTAVVKDQPDGTRPPTFQTPNFENSVVVNRH